MEMLNSKIDQSRKELISKRKGERALACESLGKQFPVAGLYYIRELGQVNYVQGIHQQLAIVNWRPDREQVWLDELTFTINLTPLLNPLSNGPKDISYKTLLKKIIRVHKAYSSSGQVGNKILHADVADWKIMEKFDVLDMLLMISPEDTQAAIEEDLNNWENDTYLNAAIEDAMAEDIPDEDPLDFDQIPEDDYDLSLVVDDDAGFLDYEDSDDDVLPDDESEEDEASDPEELNK